ncbi:MAG: hypothetical protein WBQ73_01640 [Candidatus Babeliales bacterium]
MQKKLMAVLLVSALVSMGDACSMTINRKCSMPINRKMVKAVVPTEKPVVNLSSMGVVEKKQRPRPRFLKRNTRYNNLLDRQYHQRLQMLQRLGWWCINGYLTGDLLDCSMISLGCRGYEGFIGDTLLSVVNQNKFDLIFDEQNCCVNHLVDDSVASSPYKSFMLKVYKMRTSQDFLIKPFFNNTLEYRRAYLRNIKDNGIVDYSVPSTNKPDYEFFNNMLHVSENC